MNATARQIKTIMAIIATSGLMDQKETIIKGASASGSTSTKELTFSEAAHLIEFLNKGNKAKPDDSKKDKMIRKLVAMSYDLNWIKEKPVVKPGGKMETKKDYSALYKWVEDFGYLKKPLKLYTEQELPKLLTQFEQGPHQHFLNRKK